MINNRQQSGRRRGRGGQRQNSPGGNNNSGGNGRGPESGNRIDNRARGNAAQLLEKYKTLARDAQQAGDRVLTEYYLQFADHYFRVLSETRARYEENNPSRARQDFGNEEQGFEGEEGDEGQDDDDDFAGSFRQPQRTQPQQVPQPQQNREDRPREDRPREDRPRENRAREDRPREDRPRDERVREDRPREDRPRTSYQRDDRPREQQQPRDSQARDTQPRDSQRDDRPREQPQREVQQQDRDQNVRPESPRDEQPREDRVREPRVRRDYGADNRSTRVSSPAPQVDVPTDVAQEDPAPVARQARRPRAARPVVSDHDDGEARLDVGVLPPAFSLPPAVSSEPVPEQVSSADGEVAPPKRRGRPRKIPLEAPVEN